MKSHGLADGLRYALAGLREAYSSERNFRVQLLAAAFAVVTVLWLQPPLIWAALIGVMIGLVLAAELVNSALERTLDGLHPERAEFVRIAKDCAAAAVLVLSVTSVVVFVLMLADVL
ncbi:MAG TPA: diacylglycerol kinase [Burkholderiales bacterium]|nr:diacylglycerol kinase [Burkholderiales bacterium]